MNLVASPVAIKVHFGAVVFLTAAFAAGSASAAPTSRGVGRFDGTWSVVVITEYGLCDGAARYRAVIKGGEVHDTGGNTFSIMGVVERSGTVRGRITRGSTHADVTGRLRDRSGSGTWAASGLAACRGRWSAERRT